MTSNPSAYFLVAHGSRSPQSRQSLNQLAHFFETRLQEQLGQQVWVNSGCLEFQECSLGDQLANFAQTLPSDIQSVRVLPVFLLPGNHVRQDIPEEIHIAQAQNSDLQFELMPHLGSHPAIKSLLQAKMQRSTPEQWILLGHGSRREEGNQSIRQLAKNIQAECAFWAVQPSLKEVVQSLVAKGNKTIGVLPYFLFSGKITQAISTQVSDLSQEFPQLEIECESPLSPTESLADVLIDLGQTATQISVEWQTYVNAKRS